MFTERNTDDGKTGYQMAREIERIREDYRLTVDWLCAELATGRDPTFSAAMDDGGALKFQTPAGSVTTRLEFVLGADGRAMGRVVFAEVPIAGWDALARPLFAFRIDADGKITNGDSGTRAWDAGRQTWLRAEAIRLGYEIIQAQLAAATARL
jgi:hypothetical protein